MLFVGLLSNTNIRIKSSLCVFLHTKFNLNPSRHFNAKEYQTQTRSHTHNHKVWHYIIRIRIVLFIKYFKETINKKYGTLMPSSRSIRATPAPTPLAAPVTNATLPLRSWAIVSQKWVVFVLPGQHRNCSQNLLASFLTYKTSR